MNASSSFTQRVWRLAPAFSIIMLAVVIVCSAIAVTLAAMTALK